MLVDFEKLSLVSRVWIYQSNRSFTDDEINKINLQISDFLKSWTAHGNDLQAAFLIKYKRFIILSIDESFNKVTGCSIDSSVRFIQELESIYNINLLDKMNVSYKHGEFIAYKPLSDFKKMIKNKSISPNTIVFNNLVVNKHEFLENWEVPAIESWHGRFFK
jgi:hypothetical protein